MVFCNIKDENRNRRGSCHNPYFNRWFSAIHLEPMNKEEEDSHNPYFNRWFSAINTTIIIPTLEMGHNPYFNRWFSAILTHTIKS